MLYLTIAVSVIVGGYNLWQANWYLFVGFAFIAHVFVPLADRQAEF